MNDDEFELCILNLLEAQKNIHEARMHLELSGASFRDVNWFNIKLVNTMSLVLIYFMQKLNPNRIQGR